jgi:hypothetical protein
VLFELLAAERFGTVDVVAERAVNAATQAAILIGVGLNRVIIQWSFAQLEVNEWILAVEY